MTKLSDIPEDKDVMLRCSGWNSGWRTKVKDALWRLGQEDDLTVYELVHTDIQFTTDDLARWIVQETGFLKEDRLASMYNLKDQVKEVIKRLGKRSLIK